jgi:23S rRNA G2069 N7-methylase RlmK/C1962 C5-methylase RlmI
MSDAKLIMFDNRLKKVYRILKKQAEQQDVSCYRLYDRDLPEFPLIIDIYGDNVLVTEYRSNHRLSEEDYERRTSFTSKSGKERKVDKTNTKKQTTGKNLSKLKREG